MSDRWLWEKKGRPDPEVERLERLLSPLAHRGQPLELPDEGTLELAPRRGIPPYALSLAAAAALAVVAGLSLWMAAGRGWEVARLDGAPTLGSRRLERGARARGGELLVTDARSSARIEVGKIGVVDVGPSSRLRIVGRRGSEHRLELERGVLDAIILAPPRQFVVETPSATAVDLGCAYTLEVDVSGAALLTVVAGWVSFEHDGRASFVPAGARCATRPGMGPGTPYFTDAAPELKNALALVDRVVPETDVADEALAPVLATARREDAFTLWHLLGRLAGPDRERTFARLSELVPPPAGVTLERVMVGDRAALDLWWDSLGLGGSRDWRRWMGPEPAPAS